MGQADLQTKLYFLVKKNNIITLDTHTDQNATPAMYLYLIFIY